MIRVVAEHSPQLFSILGIFDEKELTPTIAVNQQTYYRVETRVHFVRYRAAVSGHGGSTFDPRQR